VPSPVFVLNGPNLNLLGTRQPELYGHDTLPDVRELAEKAAAEFGLTVDFRQSNHEGTIIDSIHEARDGASGIVINPAAYTHTSIAIMDALLATNLPVVEVHLSNPHRREPFRHESFVSKVADAVICGCGAQGYALALQRVATLIGVAA
jgi:3-dehydroquinate dehydratase II